MKLTFFLNFGVILFACSQNKKENRAGFSVEIKNTTDVLCQYHRNGICQNISAPVFKIAGKEIALVWEEMPEVNEKIIHIGIKEVTYSGFVEYMVGLKMNLKVRIAPDKPVIRFQHILESEDEVQHTKLKDRDNIPYFSLSFADFNIVKEVRLSEYDELVHAYQPAERTVHQHDFENTLSVAGPIICAQNDAHTILLAFEHGSQLPDRYLEFNLNDDRKVTLSAVKGYYWNNQPI